MYCKFNENTFIIQLKRGIWNDFQYHIPINIIALEYNTLKNKQLIVWINCLKFLLSLQSDKSFIKIPAIFLSFCRFD